jgi:hypothetical protein
MQKAKTVSENTDSVSKVRQMSRVGFFIQEIGDVPRRSSSFQLPNVSRQMPGG